jgi:predicted GNAT superfamily acetyltransferase
MISFLIAFGTAEPDAALGHMVGVHPDYRNSSVGLQILRRNFEQFERDGIRRCYTTFEPLESRNAHIYINRFGGRGVAYKKAHYYIDSGLHQACRRIGCWLNWTSTRF